VINSASRNRPIAASVKARVVPPSPSGRAKPSVNNEDPDSVYASRSETPSIAANMSVYPMNTSKSQTPSVTVRLTGA
jgi:hypothetical protein